MGRVFTIVDIVQQYILYCQLFCTVLSNCPGQWRFHVSLLRPSGYGGQAGVRIKMVSGVGNQMAEDR
jgi:hypothetical protein